MKGISDFKNGFFTAFHGIKFLFNHISLIRLAVIPWLINLILFLILIFVLYTHLGHLIALLMTRPETWYGLILYYLLSAFIFFTSLILGFFVLCFIGNIIAAPFHEWITRNTKFLVGGNTDKKENLPFWKEAKRIIKNQSRKLLILLLLEICALAFLLIPFLGTLLCSILTFILLAFQFLEFPFEIERFSVSQQIKTFFQFPLMWLGFGCGITLLLTIPIINLTILPAGVVGATLLFYKHIRH